ncbi:tryptophan synthase beta subunit-like PLP-dependent enzyme [Penicillium citrinum]|uniref:Tryptophan synthase beta subunit-like PLP-dependent enzyme n=2 Tax=Penicillium TaxID=5073 RepID=A0A9W9TTH9_PENCI|nr:tryptophan synthase beta subunit-like PLP-dependent enzyme [Penicillium citrinum]KAJ5240835.1 tryptophan synthase beta subunit-like PLP-dependent enzyme [Penicillium citrinum]KAJ5585827.1 tryptophan synthase beta subunit-like PLP-dependent enzyme [Penicillium hetheringtonii]
MSTTRNRSILDAVGNTPCVELRHVIPQGCARVFVKLEGLNPTGSYKDRMAKSVIEEAERRGDLKQGMTIVEATGGSTGSSLAFICAIMGYKFLVVSSDAFAEEKLKTMSAFGATVDIVHSPSGKITPDLIPSMRQRATELSQGDDFYYADQFSNPDVLVGYEGLGRELLEQIPEGIDAFCGAVGGAGMIMGVAQVLKNNLPNCDINVLEPASAPALTKGHGGLHSVEGIGIGFLPPLLNGELYDHTLAIEESEGRVMARRLAKEEGILAGTSTGLNVVAAIELARQLGPGKVVATVACDTGLKYVRGDLYTVA